MKISLIIVKIMSRGIVLKNQREDHELTVKALKFSLMRKCLHWSKSSTISSNCTILNPGKVQQQFQEKEFKATAKQISGKIVALKYYLSAEKRKSEASARKYGSGREVIYIRKWWFHRHQLFLKDDLFIYFIYLFIIIFTVGLQC